MEHKYLTAALPGTGGVIKETPEDFLVAEVPGYLPCGEGEHTFIEVEKRGIGTLEVLRRLAKALAISDRDLGYAGMKDAVGVTRQFISVPRVPPERLLSLELPGFRVLSAKRHKNKLKLGHLKGNRFRLRIREGCPDAADRAKAVLAELSRRGVPNFFGVQRYGAQGNSHLIGGALLRGDLSGAVAAIIGDPVQIRDERWRLAIEAYRYGDLAESLRLFPGHCRTERDLLARLLRQPDDPGKALRSVHPRMKKLYLSAYQSWLFDRLLDQRLATIDTVVPGDLAFKHVNGACFLVTDVAEEMPRVAAFEISPSGPMFGCRMTLPEGDPLLWEQALLESERLALGSFDLGEGLRMEGERRALRVPLHDVLVEVDPEGVVLEFALPRGSYATTVLREVMKSEAGGHSPHC
jgi:tRNA pseudouridine13 synthase